MRLLKVNKKEKQAVDAVMVFGGIVGPLSAIPQILNIYGNQDAGSVSLFTWVLFTILSFVGIIYCLIHRDKIILIGYTLYFIVDLAIVVGILIYS